MNRSKMLLDLVNEYQRTRSEDVFNQIIVLCNKLIDWYLKNTNIKLSESELYLLIIESINELVLRYDKNKNSNISSYISLGIRNSIIRKMTLGRDKLLLIFLDYKKLIETKFGVTLEKNFKIFDYIIDAMIDDGVIRKNSREKIKSVLIEILKDYYGNLKITNAPSSNQILNSNIELPEDIDYLDRLLKLSLNDKEYYLITSSFGLFGKNPSSLVEIGKKLNVTSECIRQSRNRIIEKLKSIVTLSVKHFDIDNLLDLLKKILTEQEFTFLAHYYNLFGYDKLSYQEISKMYNVNISNTSPIVHRAIQKIVFYFNYQSINPLYTKEEFDMLLKNNLTKEEYETFMTYHGLFGKTSKSKEEIRKSLKVSEYQINLIFRNACHKIETLIMNDEKIINFFKSVLTKEEWEYLSLKYGLLGEVKEEVTEIANMKNKTVVYVTRTIKMAMEKIRIALEFNNNTIDSNIIQEYLKIILTEEEYDCLCQKYGLFGYSKMNSNEICKAHDITDTRLTRINTSISEKIVFWLKMEQQNTKSKELKL